MKPNKPPIIIAEQKCLLFYWKIKDVYFFRNFVEICLFFRKKKQKFVHWKVLNFMHALSVDLTIDNICLLTAYSQCIFILSSFYICFLYCTFLWGLLRNDGLAFFFFLAFCCRCWEMLSSRWMKWWWWWRWQWFQPICTNTFCAFGCWIYSIFID